MEKRKIKDSEVKAATERVKKEAKKAKLVGEKMLKKKPKNYLANRILSEVSLS